MLKFSQIKSKIQNLGQFKNLKEIKKVGLRIVYNKKADKYWLIEQEFLKPVIKSPRECKSIVINLRDLKYQVFMCHKSKEELKNYKAKDYIKWGERQGFDKRPSCKARKEWWSLIRQEKAFCSYPMVNNERLIFCKNDGVYNDANLVGLYPHKEYNFNFIYSLNSTYNMINMELLGIANLGEINSQTVWSEPVNWVVNLVIVGGRKSVFEVSCP